MTTPTLRQAKKSLDMMRVLKGNIGLYSLLPFFVFICSSLVYFCWSYIIIVYSWLFYFVFHYVALLLFFVAVMLLLVFDGLLYSMLIFGLNSKAKQTVIQRSRSIQTSKLMTLKQYKRRLTSCISCMTMQLSKSTASRIDLISWRNSS